MAAFIACMSAAPLIGGGAGLLGELVGGCAFSALRLVMLDISSSEALVCSSEAACSLAPSASDWLESEICSGGAGHLVGAVAQFVGDGAQRQIQPADDEPDDDQDQGKRHADAGIA
jgi:hypothetical protein